MARPVLLSQVIQGNTKNLEFNSEPVKLMQEIRFRKFSLGECLVKIINGNAKKLIES